MAKIAKVQEVAVDRLVPYAKNAKRHSAKQVEKIAASIEEFGFLSPCLIDKDYNLIAGHGRVQAAKKLGLKKVPCLFVEGLTEAQRRAYVLTDNRLTEMGDWDMDLVNEELQALSQMDFDVPLTGFDFSIDNWFDDRKRYDNDGLENESEEYQDFVEKFEPKRTTDDCYTPDLVYEAVVQYCEDQYGLNRSNFVRPFYPGGDYQHEAYPQGCVVVDNPPFSIESEIVRFYIARGIKFFLFAPALTLFTGGSAECTALPVGARITYENGAVVPTSFLTNLDPAHIRVRTAPKLYQMLDKANSENLDAGKKNIPKYTYPDEVITAALVQRWSKYGVDFKARSDECERISALDAQKECGKAIFGNGYILSGSAATRRAKAEEEAVAKAEKAAAEAVAAAEERAAGIIAGAIAWQLSDREREIVRRLGGEGE